MGMFEEQQDIIEPDFYHAHGIEAFDVIEAFELDYHLGSAVAYLLRAGKKGAAIDDIKKAKKFLDRKIQCIEDQELDSNPEKAVASHHATWTITEADLKRDGDKTIRCAVMRRHKRELETKLAQLVAVMDEMGCVR